MAIEEPVLPDWVQTIDEEEEEDNVPLTARLKAVKKERAKRGRSPVKAKKSPAKKKQKKGSSEEEVLKSAGMDDISEDDAEETHKVSMEMLSDSKEEEGARSEEGSSGDRSDFAADPPPTPPTTKPTQKPPSPKPQSPAKPPTHDQTTPQSKAKDQPIPQSSPIQPEPEKQPHQPSIEKEPSVDVTTSEATEIGSNPEQDPKPQPKKQRVKSVLTHSPFGTRKRSERAAASEKLKNDEAQAQLVDKEATKREKLKVTKKSLAPKGKPATATSAAFVSPSGSEVAPVAVSQEGAADVTTSAEREAADKLAELQALKAHEAAIEKAKNQAMEEATQQLAEHLLKQAQDKADTTGDASTDVPTSHEPEVEKAQVDPQESEQADPEEVAKQKAWEEAKKRIADTSAKMTQPAEVSVAAAASSGGVGSDETTTTEAGEAEKKKKERKKKGAQASTKQVRQSGRLRSGVLPK